MLTRSRAKRPSDPTPAILIGLGVLLMIGAAALPVLLNL